MPGDVEDIEATPPVIESEFVSADDKEDGSIAKQALMAEMSGGMGGPKPDKAAIGEILLALEARNPTPSPATSELLNGKWKVLYATGASPGLKALTLLLKGAEKVSSLAARPAHAPRPPRQPPRQPPRARPAPALHAGACALSAGAQVSLRRRAGRRAGHLHHDPGGAAARGGGYQGTPSLARSPMRSPMR